MREGIKSSEGRMRAALFQFATNATGKVAAVFEHLLALYLMHGLEHAAHMQVIDLLPPAREGEVLSLVGAHRVEEVREAARRVSADICLWGELRFGPEGRPRVNEVRVTLMMAASGDDGEARSAGFHYSGLRGDVRSGELELDLPALEDLVEEMIREVAGFAGLEEDCLDPARIGEGLPRSDGAAVYFIYALRMVTDPAMKLRLYLKAIAADPYFPLAYTNAAQLLLGEGRHGEALKLLLRAESRLKGSEFEPDVLNLAGVATLHMGMWEDAVKLWLKALELCPDHVETLCNLAAAYAMRELYDEAEGCYRAALSWREDYPLAWFSLGRLQARRGMHEEAEASMRRYIELCPGDPWAYYVLGTSLSRQGREAEAEFSLAKAAQLDPDGEAGALARRELDELRR